MKVISLKEYDCIKYTKENLDEIVEILTDNFTNDVYYEVLHDGTLYVDAYGYRGFWEFTIRINDYVITGHDQFEIGRYEEFKNEWKEKEG